jgi:hypothetical protein
MKNLLLIFLLIPAVNNAMSLAKASVEQPTALNSHVLIDGVNRPAQMEMGQAHHQLEARPMLDTCCDCASSPKLYASIWFETKAFEYLVDKTASLLEQQNQTALVPTIYASAVVMNGAAIVGTCWYLYRQNKLKDKED